MSINFRWGRFASWCRKNGLFCAIISWIFLAIIAYTLLSAIWGRWTRLESRSHRVAHWRDSRSSGSHQSHFNSFRRCWRSWLPSHQVP